MSRNKKYKEESAVLSIRVPKSDKEVLKTKIDQLVEDYVKSKKPL